MKSKNIYVSTLSIKKSHKSDLYYYCIIKDSLFCLIFLFFLRKLLLMSAYQSIKCLTTIHSSFFFSECNHISMYKSYFYLLRLIKVKSTSFNSGISYLVCDL